MSYVITPAVRPDTDAALIAPEATQAIADRFAICTGTTPGNFFFSNGRQGFTSARARRAHGVLTVSGNRVTVFDLDRSETFCDGALDGATVHIYRVVNGAMEMVREDTIATAHIRPRKAVTPTGQVLPAASTREWRWAPESTHRRGVTVWFAVSTVAADGSYSPPSSWVTYTVPAGGGAASVTNGSTIARSLVTETGAVTAPTGVSVTTEQTGFVALVTWNAVAGAHGYVVWRTQYNPVDLLEALDLTGGVGKVPVLPGDMLIYDLHTDPMDGRGNLYANRYWSAESTARSVLPFGFAEDHPGCTFSHIDDPIEGRRLRVTVAAGSTFTAGPPNKGSWFIHGGTGQTAYPYLDGNFHYGMTLRARGAVGGEQVLLARNDQTGGANGTVTLTTSWATHSVQFPKLAAPATADIYNAAMAITGPATVDLSWLVMHRMGEGEAPLQIQTDDIARLTEYKPSFIRTCETIKSHPWTSSLDAMAGRVSQRKSFGSGDALHPILTNMVTLGCNPWLQIEWVWRPDEWLGLAEYLFAPYDPGTDSPATKPWAYRRHMLGRTAPWIDAFEQMWLEPGNENWNSVSTFYLTVPMAGATAAQANALILDLIARTMKSSPYWTPSVAAKFKFVLGGWRPAHGSAEAWTSANAATSLEADIIVHQDYIGGSDANLVAPWQSESAADWEAAVGNVVRNGTLSTVNKMIGYVAAPNVARTKPNMLFGTYEGGPGEILGTLALNIRQSEQRVLKSHGMGTAVLDQFLLNAAKGHAVQTLFYYGLGFDWASHSHPSAGALPAPGTIYLSLMNRELFPARVRDVSPLFRPTGVISSVAGDLVSVYRIDGENGAVGLAICNRDTTATHSVTARMSGLPATGMLTRYRLSGDYDDNNTTFATRNDVALVTEAMPYATTLVATIPAGSAHLYIWRQA